MKFKKTFFSLGGIFIVSISLTILSIEVYKEKKSLILIKIKKNKKLLEEILNKKYNYEKMVNNAKKSLIYNRWIKTYPIENMKNFDETINNIFKLKMSYELRLWLLQNYLDKFLSWERKKIDQERNKIVSNAPIGGWEPIRRPTRDIEGLSLPSGGGSSYSSFDQNYLYIKSKKNPNDWEYFRDNYYNRIWRRGENKKVENYYVFSTDETYYYWDNQTVFENGMQELNKRIFKHFFTKEQWKHIIQHTAIWGEIGRENLVRMLLKNDIRHLKIAMKFATSSFVLSAIFNVANYDWDHPIDSITGEGIKDAINAIAISIGVALGSLVAQPEIGAVLANLLVCLFETIPGKNGHSLMSNIDDHGLNDWDFQIKNNISNIRQNAINWSNNYENGIVWKITDGWFSLPDLYIKTQGEQNWKLLSPGKSFNYGNKIKVFEN